MTPTHVSRSSDAASQRFGKGRRLRRRAEFQKVFDSGQRIRGRFFTLMVDELDRFFHGHETLYDLSSRTLANRFGKPAPER